ncbi:unnamed protein product [Gordionus sp. m RMFG-2023]|uniref:uncharacterized protein LOC135927466 isoform X1 n=1 Tax=Gordionus sp. m RMFG-2023 TaxID=3053472 RepID=UPI0030E24145
MYNFKLIQLLESNKNSSLTGFCFNSIIGKVFLLGSRKLYILNKDNPNIQENAIELIRFQDALDFSKSEINLLSFDFIFNYDSLCLIYGGEISKIYMISGYIYRNHSLKCVKDFESYNITASSWSLDQEIIILTTNKDEILVLNSEFDIIKQMILNPSNIGANEHVSLGWGSMTTQFKGSAITKKNLKATANTYDKLESNSSCIIFNEHENKVQNPTCKTNDFKEFKNPYISWNVQENRFFAISTFDISHKGNKDSDVNGIRKIRIYDRNNEWNIHTTVEYTQNLMRPICWRPDYSDLLTTISKPETPYFNLTFFENNGLKLGGFDLNQYRSCEFNFLNGAETTYNSVDKGDAIRETGEIILKIGWNVCKYSGQDPIVLAILIATEMNLVKTDGLAPNGEILCGENRERENEGGYSDTRIELWTSKNYHWYLKGVLSRKYDTTVPIKGDDKIDYIRDFIWDTEEPLRIHTITRQGIYSSYTWASHFDVHYSSVCDNKGLESEVINMLVIEGCKLLVTPINYMIMPLPYYAYSLDFDAPINYITYMDPQNNHNVCEVVAKNFTERSICSNLLFVFLVDSTFQIFRLVSRETYDNETLLLSEQMTISPQAKTNLLRNNVPMYIPHVKVCSINSIGSAIYSVSNILARYRNQNDFDREKDTQNITSPLNIYHSLLLPNFYRRGKDNPIRLAFVYVSSIYVLNISDDRNHDDGSHLSIEFIGKINDENIIAGIHWVYDPTKTPEFLFVIQDGTGNLSKFYHKFVDNVVVKHTVIENGEDISVHDRRTLSKFPRLCESFSVVDSNGKCLGLSQKTKSLYFDSHDKLATQKPVASQVDSYLVLKNSITLESEQYCESKNFQDDTHLGKQSKQDNGKLGSFWLYFTRHQGLINELHSSLLSLGDGQLCKSKNGFENSKDYRTVSNHVRKSIEAHSTLVCIAKESSRILLLAPRGNFEVVYSKSLLIDEIECLLAKFPVPLFRQAFERAKKHRLPYDLLLTSILTKYEGHYRNTTDIEHRHLNHLKNMVTGIGGAEGKNDNDLSLLLANLTFQKLPNSRFHGDHPAHVNMDDYKNEFYSSVIDVITQRREAISRDSNLNETKWTTIPPYFLSFLTSCAKKQPPDFKTPLKYLNKFSSLDSVSSSLNLSSKGVSHLLYFTDPDTLYKLALATYDPCLPTLVSKYLAIINPDNTRFKPTNFSSEDQEGNPYNPETLNERGESKASNIVDNAFYRNSVIDTTLERKERALANVMLSALYRLAKIYQKYFAEQIETLNFNNIDTDFFYENPINSLTLLTPGSESIFDILLAEQAENDPEPVKFVTKFVLDNFSSQFLSRKLGVKEVLRIFFWEKLCSLAVLSEKPKLNQAQILHYSLCSLVTFKDPTTNAKIIGLEKTISGRDENVHLKISARKLAENLLYKSGDWFGAECLAISSHCGKFQKNSNHEDMKLIIDSYLQNKRDTEGLLKLCDILLLKFRSPLKCLNLLAPSLSSTMEEKREFTYEIGIWNKIFWLILALRSISPTYEKRYDHLNTGSDNTEEERDGTLFSYRKYLNILCDAVINRCTSQKDLTHKIFKSSNQHVPSLPDEISALEKRFKTLLQRLKIVMGNKLLSIPVLENNKDDMSTPFDDLSSTTSSTISTMSSNSKNSKMGFVSKEFSNKTFDNKPMWEMLEESGGMIKPPSKYSTASSVKSSQQKKSTSHIAITSYNIPKFVKRATLQPDSAFEHVALVRELLRISSLFRNRIKDQSSLFHMEINELARTIKLIIEVTDYCYIGDENDGNPIEDHKPLHKEPSLLKDSELNTLTRPSLKSLNIRHSYSDQKACHLNSSLTNLGKTHLDAQLGVITNGFQNNLWYILTLDGALDLDKKDARINDNQQISIYDPILRLLNFVKASDIINDDQNLIFPDSNITKSGFRKRTIHDHVKTNRLDNYDIGNDNRLNYSAFDKARQQMLYIFKTEYLELWSQKMQ